MNMPLYYFQTAIIKNLNSAFNLVSHFRHAPMCFSQTFNMYEMSNTTEETIIIRHTPLFIFYFSCCYCTEDTACMREACPFAQMTFEQGNDVTRHNQLLVILYPACTQEKTYECHDIARGI